MGLGNSQSSRSAPASPRSPSLSLSLSLALPQHARHDLCFRVCHILCALARSLPGFLPPSLALPRPVPPGERSPSLCLLEREGVTTMTCVSACVTTCALSLARSFPPSLPRSLALSLALSRSLSLALSLSLSFPPAQSISEDSALPARWKPPFSWIGDPGGPYNNPEFNTGIETRITGIES